MQVSIEYEYEYELEWCDYISKWIKWRIYLSYLLELQGQGGEKKKSFVQVSMGAPLNDRS